MRIALFATILAAISGCSTVKNAPGINQLFGDSNEVPLDDPTAQVGINYEIAVQGLGVGETEEETAENLRMLAIVQDQARIYKLQEKPPPSTALLRRRAAADAELVERALKSEGYYEGSATISVDKGPKSIPLAEELSTDATEEPPKPEAEPEAETAEASDPDGPPYVNIYVRKGPRYSLARQKVLIEPPVAPETEMRALEAASVNVSGPAQGKAVVEGEQAALAALNQAGRPYAKKGKRRAEANFDNDTLDIITQMIPGPNTVYGTTTISGETEVETAYIEDFVTWEKGKTLSRGALRDVQRKLAGTRLFDSVTVEIPTEAPADLPEGETFYAPIDIVVKEAKHRTISAGVNYSTVDGPGVRFKWQHRNLRGQNEQLSTTLDISRDAQSAEINFKKPRFDDPDRDLVGGLRVFHEETDAYDVTGVTGSFGIEQQLTRYLYGTLAMALDISETDEDGDTRRSYLFGLPASLVYDDTDDLLDPTEGIRGSATVTPWGGVYDNDATTFLITDLKASTYIPFDRKKRYVFALRGRGAAILADSHGSVPAQYRLYSGGGGSVRGYQTQYVGPFDSDGDPEGGLTALEVSAEMRMRFGAFGVVPFVDGGTVSRDLFSEYDSLRYAAGLGLRYHSPVGPIRFDLALPLDKRAQDDSYQFYISIGQAF